MRTQKRHSRHIPYGTATLGFRKDPRCYRTAKRTMEENTFANAILEQLNDLLDGPWNDCLSDPEDVNAQTSDPEDGGPSPRAGAAGNFRQLAPATVEAGPGPVVCGPRARRQPPAPTVPEPLREQDRLLPMANVARLMALELPKDAKISRDAKVLMQEMVTEFICITTSEANDFSIAENHKAITQDDLLNALEALGVLHAPSPARGNRHSTLRSAL